MNKLIIDFETRSRCELKTRGVYVYAEDPSTDIICMAAKWNDEDPVLWISPPFLTVLNPDGRTEGRAYGLPLINADRMLQLIAKADEIHAHNAQFERVMWQYVMTGKYGYPAIPMKKWRCTAAKAAYFALPRALGMACEALHLPQQKDQIGYRTMLKLCKPRSNGQWNEDPADFLVLFKYCIQDVVAEYTLDKALLDLPEKEQELYELDQKINDRGVAVDVESIKNLMYKVEEKERRLLMETQSITGGVVRSPKQVEATIQWMKSRGVIVDDLTKASVLTTLGTKIPADVKRLLEIRQAIAKSSVAKLDAMMRFANADGRVRGTLLYYGANTGRWAGKGIQPQNFPRESFLDEDIQKVLYNGIHEVDQEYGCTMTAASRCLRGMIWAGPGKTFLCMDFASIEARVLAWLAAEKETVEAFAKNEDLYKIEAGHIFKKKAADIDKAQRMIGKVAVLALGYQGWTGAFAAMAEGYGLDLLDRAALARYKEGPNKPTPEEEKEILERPIVEIIRAWRESHPRIVEFWRGVETAALLAVKTKQPHEYGGIKYGVRGRFLHCRLPSGRLLAYCDPGTKIIKTKYGIQKEVISFWGMDSFTNKWCEQATYGGKLTENIVQAVARDLLAEALKRLDKAGFDICMHVHDEVMAEEKDDKRIGLFEKLITEVPTWAAGCPIGAEGWSGRRYKK